jgi:hypothetical protein
VFGVPIHQDKGVPAEEIAAAARAGRHAGGCARSIEDALAAIARSASTAAAHPDHRLALSCGRGAGGERTELVSLPGAPKRAKSDASVIRPLAARMRLLQQLHQIRLLLLHLLHRALLGALSGRQRSSRVPWRKRSPEKWS